SPVAQEPIGDPASDDRGEEDEQQVVRPQRRGLRVVPAEALRLVLEVEREEGEHRVEAEALPQLDGEKDVEASRMPLVSRRTCGEGAGCAHEVPGGYQTSR